MSAVNESNSEGPLLGILNRIAHHCESMEKNIMALTEKLFLRFPDSTTTIGEVQHKIAGRTENRMTEGTAILRYDFGRNHTVVIPIDDRSIYIHHCQWEDCRKKFQSVSGNPEKCPFCKRRHWQFGKRLWDLKKEPASPKREKRRREDL